VNNQQAREILRAYRPGTSDANDPHFTEALELAQRDPALGRWLEEQHELDAAIRSKFREVPVPAGLAEQIMASRKIVKPVAWWQNRSLLAAAAVLVLFGMVFGLFFRAQEKAGLAGYRKEMIQFVSNEYKLDFKTEDLEQVRKTLTNMRWPSDYVLPKGLATVHVEGGCALRWQEHKVSLLCFEAKEHDVWLFVIEGSALPEGSATAALQFARNGKLSTATWRQDGSVYLLAAPCDETTLRRFL
jgi:hypothetical protein